jgi:hypothetical protein
MQVRDGDDSDADDWVWPQGGELVRNETRVQAGKERSAAHIQFGQKGRVTRKQAEAAQVKIERTGFNFDILTAILRTFIFVARDSKPSGRTEEETQLERDPWRRADALRKE